MRAEEQFDSFYLKTRRALVHQAFALTGDLPAAQKAVRDTYVAAWHHWRKVSKHDDPRDWVRPRAWMLAQRRHTARLWHRTKNIPAADKVVLDALHQLSVQDRRVLLLGELAGVPGSVAARELSLTPADYDRRLEAARLRFGAAVDGDPAPLSPPVTPSASAALATLAGVATGVPLPRPTVVRREGRRRRRTHTAVAVAAGVFVAVGSGAVAHEPAPAPPDAGPVVEPGSSPDATPQTSPSPAGPPLPSADDLLGSQELAALVPRTRWSEVRTHDNTSGDGRNVVCQRERFADPDGLAALVRTSRAGGLLATQVLEVSKGPAQAQAAFETVRSWFAGCLADPVHLRSTYQVAGVGDRAFLAELEGWKPPTPSYSVAVAQVGQVVTTTVVRAAKGPTASPTLALRGLAEAVRSICETTEQPRCVNRPRRETVAPGPTGEEKGLLSALDLPGLSGVPRPWAGTSPAPARPNPAATTCDRAQFAQMGAVRTRTRTFLVPGGALPERFGLTETYGTFADAAAARSFLSTVRRRMADCEDRNLATRVEPPRALRGGSLDGTTWRLGTELSENTEIVFDVGFVRHGTSVAQLTFVPAGRADLPPGAFRALLVRAGQRLREIG